MGPWEPWLDLKVFFLKSIKYAIELQGNFFTPQLSQETNNN